jgi:hypothetical protein
LGWRGTSGRPEKGLELRQHEARLLEHVAVGVAAELVATGPRLALAVAILLPGVARMVVAIAVELDGQSVLRPAAVHAAASRQAIGLR